MYGFILLAVVLHLAACFAAPYPTTKTFTAVQLAQFNFKDQVLSHLALGCQQGDVPDSLYDCTYKFNWQDPNFNTSSSCETSWTWDGITRQQGPRNNFSTSFLPCLDGPTGYWQFKFISMEDPWKLKMMLSHKVEDTIHFPSTEYANFFSEGNVTLQTVQGAYGGGAWGLPGLNMMINGLTI